MVLLLATITKPFQSTAVRSKAPPQYPTTVPNPIAATDTPGRAKKARTTNNKKMADPNVTEDEFVKRVRLSKKLTGRDKDQTLVQSIVDCEVDTTPLLDNFALRMSEALDAVEPVVIASSRNIQPSAPIVNNQQMLPAMGMQQMQQFLQLQMQQMSGMPSMQPNCWTQQGDSEKEQNPS